MHRRGFGRLGPTGFIAAVVLAGCADGPRAAAPVAGTTPGPGPEAGAALDAATHVPASDAAMSCMTPERCECRPGETPFERFQDRDGDGLGARMRQGTLVCAGAPGYATSRDDPDDACMSNVHDFCGVCNGDGSSCAPVDVLAWGGASCVLTTLGTLQCLGSLNEPGLPSSGAEKCGNLSCTSTPLPVDSLRGAKQLSSAPGCAIDGEGHVWCWGYARVDYRYVPGDDNWSEARQVEGIEGATFVMAAPERNVCAVLRDGTLRCWGSNRSGNLGDGMPHEDSACPTDFDNRCSLKPVLVPGLSAVRGVTSASDLVCAWTEAGKVYCWGQLANRGLVPTTSTDNTLSPVEIPTLSKVQQLVLSESYGCALSDGKVFCFGWSRYGALGTPQPSQSQPQAPTQLTGLPPIAQLSAWEETTCARTTVGDVYCWGDARFRIVGANATLQKCVSDNDCVPEPVQVAGLKDITAISLSFSHACALTKSKQVWCWGGNFLKGLGIARGPDECADPDGCSAIPLRIL